MKSPFKIEGMVNTRSAFSVTETMDRIESVVWARCMKVFARINHQQEAKRADLDMRPMQLLIFGDSRTCIPLMKDFPSVALDMPLKVLVWETPEGAVWISHYSTEYLGLRHSIEEGKLPRVEDLVQKAME